MNETSWDDSGAMLSNGNMANMRQNTNISKDDAAVSYFFQRPQEQNDPGNYSNKKWAVGDDTMLEQPVSKKCMCCQTCGGLHEVMGFGFVMVKIVHY